MSSPSDYQDFRYTPLAIVITSLIAFLLSLILLATGHLVGGGQGMSFGFLQWLSNKKDHIADEDLPVKYTHSSSSSSHMLKGKSKSRAKGERATGEREGEGETDKDTDGHYPGLPNPTSTLCFANSVLQSLASLPLFTSYLLTVQAYAEQYDVPTQLIDALVDLLTSLNNPSSQRRVLRREVGAVIEALMDQGGAPPSRWREKEDGIREAKRLFSGGHQDSHEFFLLLTDSIKSEVAAIDGELRRMSRYTLGVSPPSFGLAGPSSSSSSTLLPQWPFQGLTANRRSCVECAYTECVRHLGFGCWSLSLQARVSSNFRHARP